MSWRTDRDNNPAAFTTDVARQVGLVQETDYTLGAPFSIAGRQYFTAKLLGDPVALTIQVIDAVGYYTTHGIPRWSYISMPRFIWDSLTPDQKRDVIGFHYEKEGGEEMRGLFPNYGKG